MADEECRPLPHRGLERGQPARVEVRLAPAAAGEPLVWRQLCRAARHGSEQRLVVDRFIEPEPATCAGHPDQVQMEIVDSGHDRRVAGIDHRRPRCRPCQDLAIWAGAHHLTVCDADRLRRLEPVGERSDDDLAAQHQRGAGRAHRSRGVFVKVVPLGPRAILTRANGTTSSQCERKREPRSEPPTSASPRRPSA